MESFVLIKFLNEKVSPNRLRQSFRSIDSGFLTNKWGRTHWVEFKPMLPRIPRKYKQITFVYSSFYRGGNLEGLAPNINAENHSSLEADGFDKYEVIEKKTSIIHQIKKVVNKTVKKLKEWFFSQSLKWQRLKK